MLNKNKNDFPLELKKKFYKISMKVNPILKLEKGEKLGRNEKGEYEIYSNRYFQQTIRWWYKQDRQKTVEYFDEDFNWVSESLSADPGFNYAPLGSPALFKIGEVKKLNSINSSFS